MSDTNEKKPRPVLIKQTKPKPQEEKEVENQEKRKVVVVKKKPASTKAAPASNTQANPSSQKKPQARVVAHHKDAPSKVETRDKSPDLQNKTEAQAKIVTQTKNVSQVKTESQPKVETQAKVEAQPKAESSAKPETQTKTDSQVKPETKSRVEVSNSGVRELKTTRPVGTGPRVVGRVGGYQRNPNNRGTGQRPGAYQGNRPDGQRSGGYQGNRPDGQRSGGYQGNRPDGQRSGGYQGNRSDGQRSGGYQGNRPDGQRSGGYQGNRPDGQRSGGYQGNRPDGQRSGGYQGNRPDGQRSGGFQGRNNGGRAGGFGGGRSGGRMGGASQPPLPTENKPTSKRFVKAKKPMYQKKEESLEQKLTLQKKKVVAPKANPIPKSIDIMETITVSDLAKKMNLKPNELIAKLMSLGFMATINQMIDSDTATILANEYGCEVTIVSLYDETIIEKEKDDPDEMTPRPPVVTIMGHVDHGKTKLLDAIRKTNVIATEFGGITQHIGAYQVETKKGKITFLDTPGHEAFTKMRARGSQITDIVVLVVAADDGVMPQTLEAIDHAKAANVPIIVAINKIDLPEANPDRIKTQLSELQLIPEDWGGTTMYFEISALQKRGIDELLDGILLTAEVLELTANANCRAEGKIIESRIDQGRGIVSSIIVERGTLHVGDCFVAGIFAGKVRAMFDDKGRKQEFATPSTPVEVIGFEGIPDAGDPFEAVEDEKVARVFSSKRQELKRSEEAKTLKKVTLDNLYATISDGEIQELKVLIKGDVHGSVEALKASLEKLSTSEIRLVVIRSAAGAINESDVDLASASDAIIIGFNVRPTPKAKTLADQERVEIRKYNVIYKAVEEIQLAMEGMLAPEVKEEDIAEVEVRDVFKVPKIGAVAGSYVLSGTVKRNAKVRVIRDGVELHTCSISSLKRFKDDAKEVAAGYECGIGLEDWTDVKVGDVLEVFEIVKISRKLNNN